MTPVLVVRVFATDGSGVLSKDLATPEGSGVEVVPPVGVGRQLGGGLASRATVTIVGRAGSDHGQDGEQGNSD